MDGYWSIETCSWLPSPGSDRPVPVPAAAHGVGHLAPPDEAQRDVPVQRGQAPAPVER